MHFLSSNVKFCIEKSIAIIGTISSIWFETRSRNEVLFLHWMLLNVIKPIYWFLSLLKRGNLYSDYSSASSYWWTLFLFSGFYCSMASVFFRDLYLVFIYCYYSSFGSNSRKSCLNTLFSIRSYALNSPKATRSLLILSFNISYSDLVSLIIIKFCWILCSYPFYLLYPLESLTKYTLKSWVMKI